MKPVKAAKKHRQRREEIGDLMSAKTARKFERDADNALIDHEELVAERYEYAKEIFHAQDVPAREAIEWMVEQMRRMAGEPVFRFRGINVTADPKRLAKIQEQSFYWIAVRLLSACAVWEIAIANFTLPEDKCAKCGKDAE